MNRLPILLALAILSACASPRPTPPAEVQPTVEPLPPEIKPLTQEQEEEIGQ
jgi:hypothetical protein